MIWNHIKPVFLSLYKIVASPRAYLSYIYNFFNARFISNRSKYVQLGLFMLAIHMFPYFIWTHNFVYVKELLFVIKIVAIILCILLLVKPMWPKFLNNYFPIYWYFVITYCLPFAVTVTLIVTGSDSHVIMFSFINLLLLIIILDWLSFIIVFLTGVSLAMLLCYKFYYKINGIVPIPIKFDLYYFLLSLALILVIGFIFVRDHEHNVNYKMFTAKLLMSSIGHEIKNNMQYPTLIASVLNNINDSGRIQNMQKDGVQGYFLDKDSYDIINKVYPSIKDANDKNNKVIYMLINAIKHSNLNVSVGELSMKKAVENSISGYNFDGNKKSRIKLDLSNDFKFIGDYESINYVIWNILNNVYKHASTEDISIWLMNGGYYNELHIRDHGVGISKNNINNIFRLFFTTGRANDSTGIGLVLCKYIIEELKGSITCLSKQGLDGYTEFIISLPAL